MKPLAHKYGFTLVELLVAIAIISVVIAIGMVNLLDSREESQNQSVIVQVYEYQKALQLRFAEAGSYPGTPYSRAGLLCLGEDAPLDCLGGSSDGVPVSPVENPVAKENLRAAIEPYMRTQPHIIQQKAGRTFSSPAYSGCRDNDNPSHWNNSVTNNCTYSDYSIWFVLIGTNEDCGRATVADPEFESAFTLCRLQEEN